MNSIPEFEPHELLPVAAMRCLAIVEYLGRSKSTNSDLTLQKAAIFDSALKNPKIARRLLSELAPEKLVGLEFPQILYPGETEHGETMNKRDITKIAALLSHAELITLEPFGGTLVLRPKGSEALLDISQLPERWQTTLRALKGIASKSASTLQQAALRESNIHAEQYIFITRAPDSERSEKEL